MTITDNYPNWANTWPLVRDLNDLAELPNEAVIRDDAGDVWEAWGWVPTDEGDWHSPGEESGHGAGRIKLPAIVLFSPEEYH